MMTFIGIIHIVVALILIILVLIQDSKSDGALGMGGGSSGSNSLLGATGAQTLAGKMTVGAAIIFALSCLTLSIMTASKTKSVVDGSVIPVTAPAATSPATETTAPVGETTAPAASPAAAPTQN